MEDEAARTWGPVTRTSGSPESSPEETFIGEYVGLAAPTGPPRRAAQLDVFGWGVRLRCLETRRAQVWEVQYPELVCVYPIRSLYMPVKGVLLRPTEGIARPMIFWTGRGADVISHLQRHGVPAEESTLTFESFPRPRVRMKHF